MEYTFHKAKSSKVLEVEPGTLMSQIRIQLGSFMAPADQFLLYYEEDGAMLNLSINGESNLALERVIRRNDQGNSVTISTSGDTSRDFVGLSTNWFTHTPPNMQMQLVLSTETPEIRAANEGKFQPYMVDDIRSVSRNLDQAKAYRRAIICEKGSIVKFIIKSWGAASFGSTITAGRATISDNVYALNDTNYDRVMQLNIQRYKGSNKTIVIDDLESLQRETGLQTDNVFDFSDVRVKTWLCSSYSLGSSNFSSNSKPPTTSYSGRSRDPREVLIPADNAEPGAPQEGELESETTYTTMSNIKADRNYVIGDINFLLMVFKDKEAAERTIEVINRGI